MIESTRNTLATLAARTRTPLPSLILSFGILHEITAVVPLVATFYAARMSGLGTWAVARVATQPSPDDHWVHARLRTWVDDGDAWAARVGARYGIFGYDSSPDAAAKTTSAPTPSADIANAVFAYGATKALMPARLAVSVYFAPAFSRGVVEPLRRALLRVFRRGS
ncbi:hypothetical protein BD779DRAFT_1513135 [Infundibulicybe gibba]|nr:hypothetical protein BD779DRAFT_1513135 [Infundibulicybe gibba]